VKLSQTEETYQVVSRFKLIRAYSALNGGYLGAARVAALDLAHDDKKNELESICYAPTTVKGTPVQIHAVLLENVYSLASDNIFFKSFSAPVPSTV